MENRKINKEFTWERVEAVFPTILFHSHLKDHEKLNSDLVGFMHQLQKEEPTHIASEKKGIWKSTGYLQDYPEMYKLNELIKHQVQVATDFMEWDMNWKISGMWFNHVKPGQPYSVRNYANNILSGLYVVRSMDSLKLNFYDPRFAFHAFAPKTKKPMAHNRNQIHFDQQPGYLIIFPSSLLHCISPNESRLDEITIGFNVQPLGEMSKEENFQQGFFE